MSGVSSGVEVPLSDAVIDALVAELPEVSCRELLRSLLCERRAWQMEAEWQPVAEGVPEPGERVQIILNAVRGPLGDRWIVDEPSYRRLIDDEAVAAWRRPLVGNKVKLMLAPVMTAAGESE